MFELLTKRIEKFSALFSDIILSLGAGICDGQSQTGGVERTQMIPRVKTSAVVKINGTHIAWVPNLFETMSHCPIDDIEMSQCAIAFC